MFEMLYCAGKIPKTRCMVETAGPAAGCTNGACIEGIVLQQSWLLPWCGEQGMDPQHCMACSAVFIAEQSTPYVASTAARASNKIDLPKLILDSG